MRFMKWISMLTVLAMLFAMLPATVAEDEIVIGMEDVDNGLELELDGDGLEVQEGVDLLNPSSLSLEDDALELDGLAGNLTDIDVGEQASASAVSNASGDFEIDEDGTLKRYGGFEKNVVIPDEVKAIGGNAFSGYTDLESVSIPSSVTYIGESAFGGCTALRNINIPDSVTTIDWWAFSGCTALEKVKLPSTLEALRSYAFSGCTSLTSLEILDSITHLGTGVFSGCTNLTSIKLPKSMTTLSGSMFSNCDSLDNLDFLSGVEKIDGSLFSDCDGMKNIIIPSSVTSIGSSVFGNCKNLESITIHPGVTFIDRTAFDGSDNVVIRGTKGSHAETYANGVGIPFNAPVVSFDDSCYDYRDDWDDANKFAVIYINQSRSLGTIQKPVDLARDLAWSSSNPEVATVDQNGVVKGISQGTTIITANTADGKGKEAQIKVVVPEPTKLWFGDRWGDETKNLEIKLRDASEIHVYSEIPYEDETKVDMPLTVTSSDDSIVIAQLSEDNKVTLKAVNLGKATITATTPDGGKASVEVEVIRPDAESIKIDQSGPIELYPGKKYSLSATLTPVEAEAKLTWYSVDTGIATVDQAGKVTAVEPGDTEIYVETDNYHEASIDIHVLTPPEKITLSKTKATLAVGDTLTLKKTLTPEDAETGFTWSSSNPSVATVSQKGKVTALEVGTAKITVKTDNGKKASCTVTVKPAPTKVKLNKTKATLGVKEKLPLEAAVSPSSAYTTLTWKSSDKAVAAVSKQGVITPKKPGTAVVTVTTHNGKTAKATITVKKAPRKVTLNRSGTVALAVGKKLKLKAALPEDTASALIWTSSAPKVASVDQKGNVKALKKGTAVITVETFNGKTAKVTISVK